MPELKEKTVVQLRKLAKKHKISQSKDGKTKNKAQLVSSLKAKKVGGAVKAKPKPIKKTVPKTSPKKKTTKKAVPKKLSKTKKGGTDFSARSNYNYTSPTGDYQPDALYTPNKQPPRYNVDTSPGYR